MRYALIHKGVVVNVIELDDPDLWPVPEQHRLEPSVDACSGDTWTKAGGFKRPPDTQRSALSVKLMRKMVLQAEADPLFFEWQAAVASGDPEAHTLRAAWLAKRVEIKARLPDPQ